MNILLKESIKSLVILMFFCLSFAYAQQTKVQYKHYTNVRFDYGVDYPSNLLIAQGEPINGDGQKFISKNKKAKMVVSGIYNINEKALKQLYEETIANKEKGNATVTYKVLEKNFFVISGISKGKIFYQKTIEKGDTFNRTLTIFKTLTIEYNESLKDTFNPITSAISKSFHNTIQEEGETIKLPLNLDKKDIN